MKNCDSVRCSALSCVFVCSSTVCIFLQIAIYPPSLPCKYPKQLRTRGEPSLASASAFQMLKYTHTFARSHKPIGKVCFRAEYVFFRQFFIRVLNKKRSAGVVWGLGDAVFGTCITQRFTQKTCTPILYGWAHNACLNMWHISATTHVGGCYNTPDKSSVLSYRNHIGECCFFRFEFA